MADTSSAVRNALVAAVVAGFVAGLVSRSGSTAFKAALFSGLSAAGGTLLLSTLGDEDPEYGEIDRV